MFLRTDSHEDERADQHNDGLYKVGPDDCSQSARYCEQGGDTE